MRGGGFLSNAALLLYEPPPQRTDGLDSVVKWVVSLPSLLIKELRPSKGK